MTLSALRVGSDASPLLGSGGHEHADSHEPGCGSISSWDISTGVDGPGTRFALFVAGCPLRCQYCHNPETWKMRDGTVVHARDVAREIGKYASFIHASGGGVTVSGGEPLLQPAFVTDIFRRAHQLDLHTALDTAGSIRVSPAIESLLSTTDLVLLDIKASDPTLYAQLTGGDLQRTLDFARYLADTGVRTWVRFVLVPGITDGAENVRGVARICAELGTVEHVDVLPYHRMGEHKYEQLGLRYPLHGIAPPTAADVQRAVAQFTDAGLDAS